MNLYRVGGPEAERLADRTDDILFMFNGDWSELLFINSAYEEIWGGSIADLEDDPTAFFETVKSDLDEEPTTNVRAQEAAKPASEEATARGIVQCAYHEAKGRS